MNLNRHKKGFTLAEALVSLAILAFVLLALSGLFIALLRGGAKSSHTATGEILAEQITTEKLGKIYAVQNLKDQFFAQDTPPASAFTGTVDLGTTTYNYQIFHKTILDTDGNPVGGDHNRLKKVDTTIWWWNDNPDDARAGYGKLVVHSTRLISEKAISAP